jgi:hypothetical protein
MLDSNGYSYVFKRADKTATKILNRIVDFNWYGLNLHILDFGHKLCSVESYNNNNNNNGNNNLIYVDDSSYLKKRVNNTKSSNNLHR